MKAKTTLGALTGLVALILTASARATSLTLPATADANITARFRHSDLDALLTADNGQLTLTTDY